MGSMYACGKTHWRISLVIFFSGTYIMYFLISGSTRQAIFGMRHNSLEATDVTPASYKAAFIHSQEESEHIVQDLKALARTSPSKRGKKFRSLVCASTRNDVHLREFLVRNLLVGFAHIVLYDNNQVLKDADYDILPMISPFVKAGLVTHIPWNQNSTSDLLSNDDKNKNSNVCSEEYGKHADWVSVMDTDEYFYISHQMHDAVGALSSLLQDVEDNMPRTCAMFSRWQMMYGERRVLKPPGLLLDEYPKVCSIHHLAKVIYRPELVNLDLPHSASCTSPDDTVHKTDEQTGNSKTGYELHLLHYYAKSVTEWITKMEQSIPPYMRLVPDSYDKVHSCNGNYTVPYDVRYKESVRSLMQRFRISDRAGMTDGGVYLGPTPEFGPGKLGGKHDLYLFFKLRVAMGDEWDEDAYLQSHEDVSTAIQERKYVDGLQHFMEIGFKEGRKTCWRRGQKRKLCF